MKTGYSIIALLILTLASTVLFVQPGLAQSGDHDNHQGFVLGFNAGVGGSMFKYKEGTRSITEEALVGGFGGMRIGYAVNPNITLSVEGRGFGRENEGEEDWAMGAGFLACTWHPVGKGFFLRGGVGVGGGDFTHPDTSEKIHVEERGAFLFSVGYDWGISDRLTLGISADTMTLDAGGFTGYDDDYLGASGLSLQLNWYL